MEKVVWFVLAGGVMVIGGFEFACGFDGCFGLEERVWDVQKCWIYC